jgi:glycosyltransferase involved in cell wall biosynthesis
MERRDGPGSIEAYGAQLPVTLVISSLSAGGAERVLSVMANHWAAKNRQVTLVTLSDNSDDRYSLDDRVRRVALGVEGVSNSTWVALAANVRRIVALRRAIRDAAAPVVISFGDIANVLTLLATIGNGTRVIVAEQTDPRRHRIGRAWSLLRTLTYRRAYRLVVQTGGLVSWAAPLVGEQRCCVIGNPVRDIDTRSWMAAPARTRRTVLGVGRLVPVKGFDILLHAFAQVAQEFDDWDVVILGEGVEREHLRDLARHLAIDERLSLSGLVLDPERVMAQSDLFVLASRYEGLPNALLEAMAVGMAVIGTETSGAREIIRDGLNGLLVPIDDVAALAQAMGRLMRDGQARASLGQGARAVRERFNIDRIMAKWDVLIDSGWASLETTQRTGGSSGRRKG